ncbi:hypothetical protein [Thermogladius calderae]|uniref:hypothetical protein n=1 Tax=Thermogladius calderae TaxID=1200300 RepID=UPI0009FC4238|nr:hypothetical protein [Thermogladius calderae]
MQQLEELVKLLDKAIDSMDKIEELVARLTLDTETSKGVVFQIYQNLVEARESVVRARLIARSLTG